MTIDTASRPAANAAFLHAMGFEFAHDQQHHHPYVERYTTTGRSGTEAVAWFSTADGGWRIKLTPSGERYDEPWTPTDVHPDTQAAVDALAAEMTRRGYPAGYGF